MSETTEERRRRIVTEILAERQRQIDVEGFDDEHDDAHAHGELADAAAAYAVRPWRISDEGIGVTLFGGGDPIRELIWPWVDDAHLLGFKPDHPRALLVAELERLERAADRSAALATRPSALALRIAALFYPVDRSTPPERVEATLDAARRIDAALKECV